MTVLPDESRVKLSLNIATIIAVNVNMENVVERRQDLSLENEILSVVAHEIGNHSQSILLIGQLLQEFWTDAEGVLARHLGEDGAFTAGGIPFARLRVDMPDYLTSVVDGAGKINSLIQEIRSVFRTPPTLELQETDLDAVARSVVLLTAYVLKKTGSVLSLRIPERLPRVPARPRELLIGLVVLTHRSCKASRHQQRTYQLGASVDSAGRGVTCELVLPLEPGGGADPVEEPIQKLFARSGADISVERMEQSATISLRFAVDSKGGDTHGH